MYYCEVYMESFYPDGVPVQYRCDRIFCCKKSEIILKGGRAAGGRFK